MLFFIATVILFPLLGVCDTLTRDDCWCWNTTHIAWNRHVEFDGVRIEGGPQIIDQWCIQETPDRRGYCLDQHTKQYEICASNEAMHDMTRRNDFCYYNHGNNRGFVTHYSEGDDEIIWNFNKRKIPHKGGQRITSTVEEVNEICEPICRNKNDWDLDIMKPWSPSKHGVVESRRQIFTNIDEIPFEDGAGGDWPFKVKENKYPGGVSSPGGGVISYWEICDYDNKHTPKPEGKKKCGM
ncbi:MAG: hypothetical protein Q9184_000452 [Pyrenodesmia sp. 2 TL-2023]